MLDQSVDLNHLWIFRKYFGILLTVLPSSASHSHLDWLHFEKKGCDNLSKYSGSWFYKLGSALSAWPIYLGTLACSKFVWSVS